MDKKGNSKKTPKSTKIKNANKVKVSIFKQINDEMKKVRWPDKKEMTKYSFATFIFIVIFGLYFFGLDVVFAWFKELVS